MGEDPRQCLCARERVVATVGLKDIANVIKEGDAGPRLVVTHPIAEPVGPFRVPVEGQHPALWHTPVVRHSVEPPVST